PDEAEAASPPSRNVRELYAYLVWKRKHKGGPLKRFKKHGDLVQMVNALTPADRDAFLHYIVEAAEVPVEEDVRAQALPILRELLKSDGVGSGTVERIVDAFKLGAAPNTTSSRATYQRLRTIAGGRFRVHRDRDAIETVARLEGAEFLQVCADEKLLTTLEDRLEAAAWARI